MKFTNSSAALGVNASDANFDSTLSEITRLLRFNTVDLELGSPVIEGDSIAFPVTVTNKAGHKFPSGYPSRRAFVSFVVKNPNGDTLFARVFANEFPQYKDFFKFRRSKFSEYLNSLPMQDKKSHELVFSYENALIVLNITPTESDWWTTLNVSDPAGRTFFFDVHYCEDYNEICVYPHNGKHLKECYVKAIHTEKII